MNWSLDSIIPSFHASVVSNLPSLNHRFLQNKHSPLLCLSLWFLIKGLEKRTFVFNFWRLFQFTLTKHYAQANTWLWLNISIQKQMHSFQALNKFKGLCWTTALNSLFYLGLILLWTFSLFLSPSFLHFRKGQNYICDQRGSWDTKQCWTGSRWSQWPLWGSRSVIFETDRFAEDDSMHIWFPASLKSKDLGWKQHIYFHFNVNLLVCWLCAPVVWLK